MEFTLDELLEIREAISHRITDLLQAADEIEYSAPESGVAMLQREGARILDKIHSKIHHEIVRREQ